MITLDNIKAIGALVLILTIGIVCIQALISIGVAVLGYIFNYPLQGLLITLAVATLLFLLPDRK